MLNKLRKTDYGKIDYGLCSKYPSMKEYHLMVACKIDVQVHFQHLNLSRQTVEAEGDLILLRSGIFDTNREVYKCPRHQEILGLSWRPKRKCAHPRHGSSKAKAHRGVTKEVSKEIRKTFGKSFLQLVLVSDIFNFSYFYYSCETVLEQYNFSVLCKYKLQLSECTIKILNNSNSDSDK